MKTPIPLGALRCALFVSLSSTLLAQGPLTPPGPPAPTMKSLDQLEARTPIMSAPFTIDTAGSYYLTKNLSVTGGDAITISASQVTLDLNGYTITSTAASATGSGIVLGSGLKNITISNGSIQGGVTNSGTYSGSGFANGIFSNGISPENVLVSKVSISGCLSYGIYLSLGNSTVVESCTVRTMGSYGILASVVKTSQAEDCGSIGIFGDQISDCRAQAGGTGISAGFTAQNCYGIGGSEGVAAVNALNCYGNGSTNHGINAYVAQNCRGFSDSGTGLYVRFNAESCAGDSEGGGDGIFVQDGTALNCQGSSQSGRGLYAERAAQNCYGVSRGSATGLVTSVAQNCFGQSQTGTGLTFTKIGSMCWGQRASTGASNYVLGGGLPGTVNLP